jgi:putative zinc finger/helix-turn-helix YgiT family protein
MYCPNCTNMKMEKKERDYHFTECGLGNVWLSEWAYFKCAECDKEMALLPDPDYFTQWLTERIVTKESRLVGDEVFFLRKALGLTGAKLAERLGFQRVEVSRWENDRNPIAFEADFRLRMDAIDLLPAEKANEVRNEMVKVLRRLTYKSVAATKFTISSQVHRELVAV